MQPNSAAAERVFSLLQSLFTHKQNSSFENSSIKIIFIVVMWEHNVSIRGKIPGIAGIA